MKTAGFCYKVLFGIVLSALCACQSTPTSFLNSFQRFVERVEQDASSYSKEDWSESDEEFEEFVGEKYEIVKDKLNSEDKRVMAELVVRYYKARVVTPGIEFLNHVGKGVVFLNDIGKDILEEFKPLKEQYLNKEAVDSLLNGYLN